MQQNLVSGFIPTCHLSADIKVESSAVPKPSNTGPCAKLTIHEIRDSKRMLIHAGPWRRISSFGHIRPLLPSLKVVNPVWKWLCPVFIWLTSSFSFSRGMVLYSSWLSTKVRGHINVEKKKKPPEWTPVNAANPCSAEVFDALTDEWLKLQDSWSLARQQAETVPLIDTSALQHCAESWQCLICLFFRWLTYRLQPVKGSCDWHGCSTNTFLWGAESRGVGGVWLIIWGKSHDNCHSY